MYCSLGKLAAFVFGLGLFFTAETVNARRIEQGCTFKGIPLYGKVRVVQAFPDIKVKLVSGLADLEVKEVSAFADSCGKWEFVESGELFTVQFVDAFEDFSITETTGIPGVR